MLVNWYIDPPPHNAERVKVRKVLAFGVWFRVLDLLLRLEAEAESASGELESA